VFSYVAYTAPHFPLQAPEAEAAKYRGRYRRGWDVLRSERMERLASLGLLEGNVAVSPRDPGVPKWGQVENQAWQERRMEVYAAQVSIMDRGIGRLIDTLEATGRLDDTFVLFLSDNGGCAEDLPRGSGADFAAAGVRVIPSATSAGQPVAVGNSPEVWPGPEGSYASYGRGWANLSNTPFRLFKRWVHEGGIASPFVAHWPAGLRGRAGSVCREPFYMPDIMPTLMEAGGAQYPIDLPERQILPLEGISMLPALRGETAPRDRYQYYEHLGNAAVRRGRWKLVREYPQNWELYELANDPTELHDLAVQRPEVVHDLVLAWATWATRCGVVPRERIVELTQWGLGERE
jgi:arylsulfatase A-like enzyme